MILINNKSEDLSEKFYGCPFCFLKLDPTIMGSLKKIEKIIEKPDIIPLVEEEYLIASIISDYLSEHFGSSIITRQCLDCKKMDNCMKNQKEGNF